MSKVKKLCKKYELVYWFFLSWRISFCIWNIMVVLWCILFRFRNVRSANTIKFQSWKYSYAKYTLFIVFKNNFYLWYLQANERYSVGNLILSGVWMVLEAQQIPEWWVSFLMYFPLFSLAQLQVVCVLEQKITGPHRTSSKHLVHSFPTPLPYLELSPQGCY